MAARAPIGGKVVVITGAARGIGELLAQKLARRGARLALLGLEPERLESVADRCGPNAASWDVDVTDARRLTEAAVEVVDRFRRVDVLVANAGIAAGGTLLVADPASYERVIEVNLLGSIRTARAFLPHLVKSRGYLLQIASLAAMTPAPLMGAYCSSKAGVEAFAQVLRTEVAHHGVRVGVAYLSWTDTDMTRGAAELRREEELRRRLPPPLGTVYPLEPAVERLVTGIERRSARVYGQSWIRTVRPLRWLAPDIGYAIGRGAAAEGEADLAARGPDYTRPVGAGGQADTAARARSRSVG